MYTIIVACRTLKEELDKAMEQTGYRADVLWIESGLHNYPKKLNRALQEALEQAEKMGAEQVIMAMGFCGNSLEGLRTGNYLLTVPRVDDCITLLIGSLEKRKTIQKEAGTYFMTKGWIDGERNIYQEYKYTVEKYGKETGREIFNMMFGNYKRIGILDTHCYEMAPVIKEAKKIANVLEMDWAVMDASNGYLEELLTGPWDERRYLTIKANSQIGLADLHM